MSQDTRIALFLSSLSKQLEHHGVQNLLLVYRAITLLDPLSTYR